MGKTKIATVNLNYLWGQEEIARVFYGRLLQLRELDAGSGELRFRFDRFELRLSAAPVGAFNSGVAQLRIPGLEDIVQELRSRGYLWLTHQGAGIVAIDPFGNRLEITEVPAPAPYLEGWAA